jgi:hypothetical protein
MVHYTSPGSGKDAGPDQIISYGAAQLLSQERPEARYHPDTMQRSFGSPSTFITDRPLPRQLHPHFDAPHYGLAPLRDGRKRPHGDNEPEVNQTTDHTYGQRPVLHSSLMSMPPYPSASASEPLDLGPYPVHVDRSASDQTSYQDYSHQVALPQQHHHHRMPTQALATTPSGGESSNYQDSKEIKEQEVDLSFLNMPGLPDRFPKPKVSKTRFGKKEDAMVVMLKEKYNLSWKQIAWFFPGRQPGTLQVRYCNLLKVRQVDWDDEKVRLSSNNEWIRNCANF